MRHAVATVLALAAIPAIAQQSSAPMQAPGSRSVAAVVAGTYTADPAHTLVTWTVDHLGFTPYTGIVGDISGTLTLDPKRLNAASVDVTIPVSKVITASAGLTAHLTRPGKDGGKPDFFGPDATARFVSTGVVARGQTARITGNLTLNGVTKPVVLSTSFYGAGSPPAQMGGGSVVGFHATTTIQRSQFGLGFGVPMVGDAVKLDIAAAFQKK